MVSRGMVEVREDIGSYCILKFNSGPERSGCARPVAQCNSIKLLAMRGIRKSMSCRSAAELLCQENILILNFEGQACSAGFKYPCNLAQVIFNLRSEYMRKNRRKENQAKTPRRIGENNYRSVRPCGSVVHLAV